MASTPVQFNPISAAMEAEVRRELSELLESPEFRASRKSQLFLSYAVEETLAGRQDSLKERVIGAEVFGRSPGFETAGDSIVRVKATEVRRRLARYYQARPDAGFRIELPTGSYIPHFHFVEAGAARKPVIAEQSARERIGRRTLGVICAGGILATAAWRFWPRTSPLDEIWSPLISTRLPIVVCTTGGPAISARRNSVIEELRRPHKAGTTIPIDDLALSRQAHTSWSTVQAIVDVSRLLSVAAKPFQVRVADEMSFEQVKDQPIVLIGMFSNPWTIELTRQLRFTFVLVPETGQYLVRDAQKPVALRHVEGLYPNTPMPVDYAIVTRLMDTVHDRPVIAIGGISGLGTRVAADFATNSQGWAEFAKLAPAGWERKNLQVLLETRIVRDTPRPPTILAIHTW